jgi:putative transposase
MRRRSKCYEHPTLFISGSVVGRVSLFRQWPKANESFTDSLDFCRNKYGFRLHGYVLMPDHYHLLLTLKAGTSLSDLLRDFKSYVGKTIVEHLRESGEVALLKAFRIATHPRRRKDPRYHVLQADNDIVEVLTERILHGKLEYMHNNPVKKGLVAQPGDWRYSSWRAYELREETPLRIDKIGALSSEGPSGGSHGAGRPVEETE